MCKRVHLEIDVEGMPQSSPVFGCGRLGRLLSSWWPWRGAADPKQAGEGSVAPQALFLLTDLVVRLNWSTSHADFTGGDPWNPTVAVSH
jgi:hypothetical protein